MRKIILIINCFMLIILLSACTNKDEIAKEFVDYYNDDFLAVEKMKQDEFLPMVYELSYKDQNNYEETEVFIEEEMLPKINEIIGYLNSVELEHEEVEELKELQIEVEEYAYTLMEKGFSYYRGESEETEEELSNYNKQLEDKYNEVRDEIESFMNKYDVVYDEGTDTGYGMRVKLESND